LTMLNDLVVVEAAQALGKISARASGSARERVNTLFRRCLMRPPLAEEEAALVSYFNRQLERLANGQLDAKTIAAGGEGDAVERAAWPLPARALLNLDEMITKE